MRYAATLNLDVGSYDIPRIRFVEADDPFEAALLLLADEVASWLLDGPDIDVSTIVNELADNWTLDTSAGLARFLHGDAWVYVREIPPEAHP